MEPNTWYLVANNFVSVGDGEQMSVQDFFGGLTPTDDAMTAPMLQYWNGTKLETLYYMNYLWDVEKEEEVAFGWGNGDLEFVDWKMDPGVASWLIIRSGTPTVTCAGQVVPLTEKSLALSSNWQLMGSPYPMSFTLNGAGIDCSGLTSTDDAMTAPLIQYWNGTKLETVYYMNYLWDVENEKEVDFGWGNGDLETVNRTFSPCEGFWVKLQSATPGVIKFTR